MAKYFDVQKALNDGADPQQVQAFMAQNRLQPLPSNTQQPQSSGQPAPTTPPAQGVSTPPPPPPQTSTINNVDKNSVGGIENAVGNTGLFDIPVAGGALRGLSHPFLSAAELLGQAGSEAGSALTGQTSAPQIASNNVMKQIGQSSGRSTSGTLTQGAKDIAGVASYLIPFGKGAGIVQKALLPGAELGAAQAFSQDNSTLPSIAAGAATGAATSGAFYGAGKLVNKFGDMLQGQGDKMTSSNLNLTAKQKADVAKEMNVKNVDEFLQQRGLGGADINKLDQHIQPLQDQFDAVAQNPDLTIKASDVMGDFQDEIKKLSESVLPSDRAKASTLQSIADNFSGKYGDGDIPASDLTQLRQQIDTGVKDFGIDPNVRSPLNAARSIIQDNIRSAADDSGLTVNGMSLKDAGGELNKLYTLFSKAEPREFASKPASLSVGGKDLVPALIGNIFGGIPGAAAGIIGQKALATQAGTNLTSKALSGVGGALAGAQLPAIVNQAANQGLVRKAANYAGNAVNSITAPQPTQNSNNQTDNNSVNQSSASLPQIGTSNQDASSQPQNTHLFGNYSQQQLAQGYLKATQAGDSKAATQLKTMLDAETAYQKDQSDKAAQPLPAAQQLRHDNITTALTSLDTAEQNLVSSGGAKGALGKLSTLPVIGQYTNPKGTAYQNTKIETATNIAKAITGGARVPETVINAYLESLPSVNDTPQYAQAKLDFLRKALLNQAKTGKFDDIVQTYQ